MIVLLLQKGNKQSRWFLKHSKDRPIWFKEIAANMTNALIAAVMLGYTSIIGHKSIKCMRGQKIWSSLFGAISIFLPTLKNFLEELSVLVSMHFFIVSQHGILLTVVSAAREVCDEISIFLWQKQPCIHLGCVCVCDRQYVCTKR